MTLYRVNVSEEYCDDDECWDAGSLSHGWTDYHADTVPQPDDFAGFGQLESDNAGDDCLYVYDYSRELTTDDGTFAVLTSVCIVRDDGLPIEPHHQREGEHDGR